MTGSRTRRDHQVRIIGGRWRGRGVRFQPRDDLRPTPDRVRETLFNWLGQDLTGLSTLDAFAGTGALSLEALSRGAALAVAVERDAACVRGIREAAARLEAGTLELHRDDALDFLAREKRMFDVVFLDPPFRLDLWGRVLALAAPRVPVGGRIYAEASVRLEPLPGWSMWRRDKAGQVHYHLLRRES